LISGAVAAAGFTFHGVPVALLILAALSIIPVSVEGFGNS
jgi:hypothetical protein